MATECLPRPQKRQAAPDSNAGTAPPAKRHHVSSKHIAKVLDLGSYTGEGEDGMAAVVNNADLDLNPLTLELVLKRKEDEEETESLRISGYTRNHTYTVELEERIDRISRWSKQSQVGGKIPRSHIQSVTDEIGMLNVGFFRKGKKTSGEVAVYGKLALWIALGIEAREAKVIKRQNGLIEIMASTTGLHVHEPACLRDYIDEGLHDEYEDYRGGITPDEATFLAQKRAFHERAAREAAEEASRKAHASANSTVRNTISELDLSEPTTHLILTRIDNDTIKAELTGYPRKTMYTAQVQQRVDSLLAKAGLPSYGAIPKKCFDPKAMGPWLKPFNSLSTGTTTCTAEAYGKEVRPILQAVNFDFIPGSSQLDIKSSSSPEDGLVTLQIGNVLVKPDLWKVMMTSVPEVYRATKGKLTKDENMLWQAKRKADKRAEDEAAEEELVKLLELEIQKAQAKMQEDESSDSSPG